MTLDLVNACVAHPVVADVRRSHSNLVHMTMPLHLSAKWLNLSKMRQLFLLL